ncbi:MAG: hypothetical protein QM581_16855 [Pseudomonas sp.]
MGIQKVRLHLFQAVATVFRRAIRPPIVCGDCLHGGSECVFAKLIAAPQYISRGNASDHEKALLKPADCV